MHSEVALSITELLAAAPADVSVLTSVEQLEANTGFPELSVRAALEVLQLEGVATYSRPDGEAFDLGQLNRGDTFLARLHLAALE